MKKVFKNFIVMLIVVASLLTSAGCKKAPSVVVIDWDPESYVPEVKGEIVVTYEDGATSEKSRAAMDSYIQAFEREFPGTKVKADYTSGNRDSRIATGDIGDVFTLIDEHVYRYAAEEKVLLELDSYAQALNIDLQNVYSGIMKMGMVNGKMYMISVGYGQVIFLYNKEAVREAGLEQQVIPSWTWYEFLEICEKLTISTDDDPDIEQHGASFDMTWDPVYIPFLEAYAGKDKWCDTELKKLTFVDEEGLVLKAVIELIEAARAGYVSIIGTTNSGQGKPVFSHLVSSIVASEVAARFSGGVEWDLLNFPLFESPSMGAGCGGFVVYNRTSNPDTAAAFSLFMFTEDGQYSFGSQNGNIPLLGSMRDTDFWKYKDGGPNGEPEWADKNWDAFVAYADTASTNGQIECRMPAEVAAKMAGSFGNIIKRAVENGNTQQLIDNFASLEQACNEIWEALIE